MCGANVQAVVGFITGTGSSPRVRGEHGGGAGLFDGLRIIPACAGRTSMNRTNAVASPDHPRVCGANAGP